ncbi:MAG TPA: hypothetical protein VNX88_05190 [Terriglobales bacterium]|jgi:hypothetical protein|nr:hypothetical protein [Terriglobales bacterium]
MARIIVGGQTKDAGKTTLICNIIKAFPAAEWTAVKFSNHRHPAENCEVLTEGPGWIIWEQSATDDQTDAARFLHSGADRGLLVQADNRSLREVCSVLMKEISTTTAVIVESASAAEFLQHDLLLLLLDAAQNDFKESTRQQLGGADAFVLRNSDSRVEQGIEGVKEKPVFTAFLDYLDPGLLRLLAAKLGSCV